MTEKRITRVSPEDLHEMKDLTDWKRVDAMTEEDIQRAAASDPDAPMTTNADWANARLVFPPGKNPIEVGIDRDIVEWFGENARGFRSKINAVLRDYIKAQEQARKAP